MDVNAGKLNQRIEILRRAYPIRDGRQTVEETSLRRCWAQVTRQSGTQVAAGSGFAPEDVGTVSTRFLVRSAPHKGVGRLDTVRYRGEDYDIQYVNDYGDLHAYTEILATHNHLRTTFLVERVCVIYNVDGPPGSAGKIKHLTSAVTLLAGETASAGSSYYTAGRAAELARRTVRLLRTEALSTAQLCEIDDQLYQIPEISQATDASGLLVTDLTLESAGPNWRDRYVTAADQY